MPLDIDKIDKDALLKLLEAADAFLAVDDTSFMAAPLRTELAQAVEAYHHRYGTCAICYEPIKVHKKGHRLAITCQECGELVCLEDCAYDSDYCHYCGEK